MNYDSYINQLYENQNIGADETQKNLYKKEQYQKLLNTVLKVLNNNKDASIKELRGMLYKESGVDELIQNFFYEKRLAPGAVITYGTKNYQETLTVGNKQEVIMENGELKPNVQKMREDTIFDLASTTKLFTSISILKLVQNGEINLEDEVVKYVPQFSNLKGVTIFDLLTFEPLQTDGRIDRVESIEEGEKILFTASKKEIPYGSNKYNDIAPMVLKYVIEKVSGLTYKEFLQKELLDKLNMDSTYVNIPNDKLDRVASGNYDGRYFKDGNYIIRENANLGVSTDDKARILGQPNGILSGHAGLFSSTSDMTKLARAIIDNKVLNLKVRDMMLKNRTGFAFQTPENSTKYRQYFGMLVYSKNPELSSSEVQHLLSGKAFASAGWSGTQQTIDPINNINLTLLSNRSHNRMTFIDITKKNRVITNDNIGFKSIILPNGYEMIDATRYAWDRDDIIRKCLELAMQYKMLEEVTNYSKNNDKIEEETRTVTWR